jgi:hypothetical protein
MGLLAVKSWRTMREPVTVISSSVSWARSWPGMAASAAPRIAPRETASTGVAVSTSVMALDNE